MYYIKEKVGEAGELRVGITETNTYTTCPNCGVEFQISLWEVYGMDYTLCEVCAEEECRKQDEQFLKHLEVQHEKD